MEKRENFGDKSAIDCNIQEYHLLSSTNVSRDLVDPNSVV